MRVSLKNAYQVFSQYDHNGDQRLTREEIAKAALDLHEQGRIDEFLLFATFVQGGKDGSGLFPDGDHDNALSLSELERLASGDGSDKIISPRDFQKLFKTQAGQGNLIDLLKLQELALGATSTPPASSSASQSVTLDALRDVFTQFDADGDGKLSKAEIARAALHMKNIGNMSMFMLLGTFLQGGKNGTGLFPDDDGDGAISFDEIAGLAHASGDGNTITPEDFQAAFPDLAGQGNGIDLGKLETTAYPGQVPVATDSPLVMVLRQLLESLNRLLGRTT